MKNSKVACSESEPVHLYANCNTLTIVKLGTLAGVEGSPSDCLRPAHCFCESSLWP